MKNLILLFFPFVAFSQIGFGNPSPVATVDIKASNSTSPSSKDGILIPRVSKLSTDILLSIKEKGMLVFLTGNDGSNVSGFYYWNGTVWVNTVHDVWKSTGNTGSNVATEFIGTTDAVAFIARTNNLERLRITSSGKIGINMNNPQNTLEINNGSSGASGLRFTNLLSSSLFTSPAPSSGALTVNTTGDVIISSVEDLTKAQIALRTQQASSGPNINVGTMVYILSDGNFSSSLLLPNSAPYIGFELTIVSYASFGSYVLSTNTNMAANVLLTTGNSLFFKWGGSKWFLLN